VFNNIFLGNTEHDIFEGLEIEESNHEEFDPVVLLLIGLLGITWLGAGWKLAMLSRDESNGE
jgi:hypothetical protein